jgi:hypothetical protein
MSLPRTAWYDLYRTGIRSKGNRWLALYSLGLDVKFPRRTVRNCWVTVFLRRLGVEDMGFSGYASTYPLHVYRLVYQHARNRFCAARSYLQTTHP